MNIPKNKKLLLIGVLKESIAIFVILIISYLSIGVFRDHINSVNANIKSNAEVDALRNSYKETYDKYSKSLENISNAKKTILQALPPTEDLREFMGILNTIASKNSITANVGIGESQVDVIHFEDIPLRTIPFTISIQGSTDNVRAYISDIEKLPYFFTLQSYDEKAIDETAKKRNVIITAKLWTKPDQLLTKMQSQ